jgi:hypothetical protein
VISDATDMRESKSTRDKRGVHRPTSLFHASTGLLSVLTAVVLFLAVAGPVQAASRTEVVGLSIPATTGTGKLTSGSNIVQEVSPTSGAFSVGQRISSAGGSLATGTKIVKAPPEVAAGTLELSGAASATEAAASLTAGFEVPCGTATDSAGNLYVLENSGVGARFIIYSAAEPRVRVTEFAAVGATCGLAVDSSGNIYSATTTGAITKYEPSSFPPTGSTSYTPSTFAASTSGSQAVAVNPANQRVYASQKVNEQQTLSFSGSPTGGTFKLENLPASCSMSSTNSITYATSNSTRKSNIEAKLTEACGSGNFTVPQAASHLITFVGKFSGQDVPLMTCNSSLTGGTSPSCAVAQGTQGAHRISSYEPNGSLVNGTIGESVSGASYYGVDVFGSNGRIYAVDGVQNKVYVFNSSGSSILTTITGSEAPTGSFAEMSLATLAVDQVNGNVLVSDIKAHAAVDEFNASGKYLDQLTHSSPALTPTSSQSPDVAVDNSTVNKGKAYVTSGAGTGGALYAYGALSPKKTLSTTISPLSSGEVKCYDAGTACEPEYAEGSTVELVAVPKPGFKFKEWANGAGAASVVACTGTTPTTCVIELSTNSSVEAVFEPAGPTVVTGAASPIGKTTATLNGTVNPNGGNVTACTFEYGLTTGYGQTAPCVPASPGAGTSPVPVSAEVTGLSPNTLYHFRLAATNTSGSANGNDATFTTEAPTPPIVTTTAGATNIVPKAAKVAGTVNPNGLSVTECKVEYGTSLPSATKADCVPAPGAGSSPVAVTAELSSLTPNTTYKFRFYAVNADGKGEGSEQEFKTAELLAPVVVTQAATGTAKTTTTLSGTVNPKLEEVTDCHFEYSTETLPAGSPSTAPCVPSPGSGNSPVSVSANLSGLTPATTYHFRLIATNGGGTTNGLEESVTTAASNKPTVTTAAGATSITKDTAQVAGTVNPNGLSVTECKVEYGTSLPSATKANCVPAPGAGSSPEAVTADLSSLTPKTTYKFRFYAVNSDGEGKGSEQEFTTLPEAPAITGISPTKGPLTAGTTVTITGTNLSSATSVKFGSGTGTVTENTATQIKITTPACTAGVQDIRVVTAGGESPNTAADDYTCVAAPAVTSISPVKGPTAGGTVVTITGTNLAGPTGVKFGTTAATAVTEVSPTQVKATAPAGSAGSVDVTVTTAGGTSATGAGDKFTFVAPFALTVTKAGAGSGLVTCDGGACAASYNEGTKVTLAAAAASDSTFSGWSGGGCSGAGSCVVTMTANTAVTATFDKKPTEEQKPPAPTCTVPKLKGKSLGQAKSALKAANCTPGKVTKPKGKKGKGPLVVKSSSPAAGSTHPEGTKVNLKLEKKPKKKKG